MNVWQRVLHDLWCTFPSEDNFSKLGLSHFLDEQINTSTYNASHVSYLPRLCRRDMGSLMETNVSDRCALFLG